MSELTCEKIQHIGTGYLHAEDDDRPYDIDGVTYCGRCHRFWPDCKQRALEQNYKRRVQQSDSPVSRDWNRSPFSFGSNSGTP